MEMEYQGRRKCELLKTIRRQIAGQYDLIYEPKDCHHVGDCSGTCPLCDAEIVNLQKQLKEKGIDEVSFSESMSRAINEFYIDESNIDNDIKEQEILQGDIIPPFSRHIEGITVPFFNPNGHYPSRMLFMECAIAGVHFHDINDVWDELKEGTSVTLERETDNSYDVKAIRVVYSNELIPDGDDYILGYISRNKNKTIAILLDMGWDDIFECEIVKLENTKKGLKAIRIAIYIRNIHSREQWFDL